MVMLHKAFSTKEECLAYAKTLHDALVESPAYVNNEVSVHTCQDGSDEEATQYDVYFVVGNDTDHNKYIEL